MKPKIALRPGEKLSEDFPHSRDCYKIVETDKVCGYIVAGGGRGGAAMICPLYGAYFHVRVGAVWHIMASYEQGARFNGRTSLDDPQGCVLATIAAQAIASLEERWWSLKREERRSARAKRRSLVGAAAAHKGQQGTSSGGGARRSASRKRGDRA